MTTDYHVPFLGILSDPNATNPGARFDIFTSTLEGPTMLDGAVNTRSDKYTVSGGHLWIDRAGQNFKLELNFPGNSREQTVTTGSTTFTASWDTAHLVATLEFTATEDDEEFPVACSYTTTASEGIPLSVTVTVRVRRGTVPTPG